MERTLIAMLALAVGLALGGCKKDKDDDDTDADTSTDTTTDTTDDSTVPDVVEDTTEDAVEDTVEDTVEDVVTDAVEDVVTDATPDAVDVVDEDGVLPCDTDLGDWTPNATQAGIDTAYSWWVIDGAVSADFTTEPVTLIEVESYGSDGGPTTTGTTVLSTFEPYDTCGLCITVYEDCTASSGCTRLYMADQATLELTALDMSVGGTVTGTLTGMYLVEYDEVSDALVTDGVAMCVDLWTFSETFVDFSG